MQCDASPVHFPSVVAEALNSIFDVFAEPDTSGSTEFARREQGAELLERAREDLYGYQIAKSLQAMSVGGSPMKQGALYPVLRTLSAHGLLASRVVPSYAGPPRRYYRITDAGRETLARWLGIWTTTRQFVDAVAGPATSTPPDSEQP